MSPEKGGEDKFEITILDRSVVREFPPGETAKYVSRVTYRAEGMPPSSVGVRLDEVAPEEVERLRDQISEQSGDLWEAYLEIEKSRVRKDVQQRRAAEPEKYVV